MENYTLVTAFYRIGDNPIQSARLQSYMEAGHKLLNSGSKIVVFCEPELSEYIRSFNRQDHVIVLPIPKAALPNFRLLDQIRINRVQRNYYPDPRNTPEYQAITCSKPWFTQKAIELDLFKSEYFAWADFGVFKTCKIEPPDFSFISEFKCDLVNAAILNCHSAELMNHPEVYYQTGRAGIGGTFWSGSKVNMLKYSSLAIMKHEEMVKQGLGHADEQIMFQVYHENPELFRLYPADYESIISNAVKIVNLKNVNEALSRIHQSGRVDLFNKCLDICRESGFKC